MKMDDKVGVADVNQQPEVPVLLCTPDDVNLSDNNEKISGHNDSAEPSTNLTEDGDFVTAKVNLNEATTVEPFKDSQLGHDELKTDEDESKLTFDEKCFADNERRDFDESTEVECVVVSQQSPCTVSEEGLMVSASSSGNSQVSDCDTTDEKAECMTMSKETDSVSSLPHDRKELKQSFESSDLLEHKIVHAEKDKILHQNDESTQPSSSATGLGLSPDDMKADEKLSPDSEENKHLQTLSSDMFHKMTAYLHGEVRGTAEDYVLLECMNRATLGKYDEMLLTARHVGDSLHSVNQKFVNLLPYLDQIEQIEKTVLSLEQAAYKLDAYTKQLEEKFKKMDRRY